MTPQDDERRHAEEVAWTLAVTTGVHASSRDGKALTSHVADLIQRERALAHDAALEEAARGLCIHCGSGDPFVKEKPDMHVWNGYLIVCKAASIRSLKLEKP